MMKVSEIKFTQGTVNDTFQDRRTLHETIELLKQDGSQKYRIPTIRVVRYEDEYYTLDNRRLKAFKEANLDEVPVIEADLSDPVIRKDFLSKKNNKRLDGGGEYRNGNANNIENEHSPNGAHIFKNRVLSWSFESLKYSLKDLETEKVLPIQYSSSTEYFNVFSKLALEEARCALYEGIKSLEVQNPRSIEEGNQAYCFDRTYLVSYKLSKNIQKEASELAFTSTKGSGNIGDILLLRYKDNEKLRLIALVEPPNDKDDDNYHDTFKVKTFIEEKWIKALPAAFQNRASWRVKSICSLISQKRIFEVCFFRPDFSLRKNLLEGIVSAAKHDDSLRADNNVEGLNNCNLKQKEAIKEFLRLKEGFQLLQGPPGTGKTTTIVTLIKKLKDCGEKILVCAPSNKAVQILASRYIKEHGNEGVMLTGNTEKLTGNNPALESCFYKSNAGNTDLENIKKLMVEFKNLINIKLNQKLILALLNIHEKLSPYIPDDQRQEIDVSFGHYMDNLNSLIKSTQVEGTPARELIDNNRKQYVDNATKLLKMISLEKRKEAKRKMAAKRDEAKIIFCTLSASGAADMKDLAGIDSLIIDEASQATEAEVLIPLRSNPKKCLLAGDTKQLEPTVLSKKAIELKYNRSLMVRLLEDNKQPYTMLTIQYRMNANIRCWPSAQYYQDKLRDSSEIRDRTNELSSVALFASYSFIDIAAKELQSRNKSIRNREEISYACEIASYLNKRFSIEEQRIGIISFYSEQVMGMKQNLINRGLHNITVYTVDSCQGDEKDFLILSFVRANTQNAIGFIDNPKRLNVALTRAKYSLIMLGNAQTLKNSNSDIAILMDDARKRGCFFEESCLKAELFHNNNQSHKRQKTSQPSFYKGNATFFQTLEDRSKETVFSVNRHENINNTSKQIYQL